MHILRHYSSICHSLNCKNKRFCSSVHQEFQMSGTTTVAAEDANIDLLGAAFSVWILLLNFLLTLRTVLCIFADATSFDGEWSREVKTDCFKVSRSYSCNWQISYLLRNRLRIWMFTKPMSTLTNGFLNLLSSSWYPVI